MSVLKRKDPLEERFEEAGVTGLKRRVYHVLTHKRKTVRDIREELTRGSDQDDGKSLAQIMGCLDYLKALGYATVESGREPTYRLYDRTEDNTDPESTGSLVPK